MRIPKPLAVSALCSCFLALFALFPPASPAASPPPIAWEATVDSYLEAGGGGYDVLGNVVPTDDGGLLAGGYAIPPAGAYDTRLQQPFVVRYDALGGELWRSHLGGAGDGGYEVRRIRGTADGGFVLACMAWTPPPNAGGGLYYDTSFLVKLDANGAELWRHRIDPLEMDAIGDFDLAGDGSIIAAGRVWVQGGSTRIAILKLSPAGARLWMQRVDPAYDEEVECVAATPAGGLYAATGNGNRRSLSLYSPEGARRWTAPIENLDGELYFNEKRAHGLTVLPDGGCAVAGGVRETYSSNYGYFRPFLATFNFAGRQTDTLLIPSESRWLHAVTRLSDGGLLAAEGIEGSDTGPVFVRYDPSGNEVWRSPYGRNPESTYIDAIRETTDGGFVASGAIEAVPRYTSMDSYLLKVDGDRPAGTIGARIDIMPGNALNPVNPRKQGVIEVALLSASDFDAPAVDPASIRLQGAPPLQDGRRRFRAVRRDADHDGRPDLVLFFSVPSLGLTPRTTTLTLIGTTPGGGRFSASDSVRFVGPDLRDSRMRPDR
jgi:hypothetical protein